jgi:hypothetical protein
MVITSEKYVIVIYLMIGQVLASLRSKLTKI